MEHPFFAEIEWDKMYNKVLAPPYKPILSQKTDIKHFDQEITNIPIESPPDGSQSYSNGAGNYTSNGVTYIDKDDDDDEYNGFYFEAESLPPTSPLPFS